MKELTFDINSNAEIWELLDKDLDHIFIHNFMPSAAIQWWKTDLKSKNGVEFKNLSVRQMKMDIQTDLKELNRILALNTNYLSVYQFDKPVPDTLELERLPKNTKDKILKQNGLKHWFWINFEFITVGSFDDSFINNIESNPLFSERIEKRKQMLRNSSPTF